jgi:hypothetical protein
MNTSNLTELHTTKLKVIEAFERELTRNMQAVLQTEKVLKEGSETEQEASSDRLTDKREEMMDDVFLHDQIAGHDKDQLLALAALNRKTQSTQVEVGALVVTNLYRVLVCVPVRSMEVEGHTYVGVTLESPLVKALLGKKAGDVAEVNGKSVTIEAVA